MRLWRISHPKFALDRLCAGAALYGGRWNPVGMPVLYCGTSVGISALEKLVHLGSAPVPPLVLVAVDLPAATRVYDPGLAALPADWDELPTSSSAQAFGGNWLEHGSELAMRVASAIVPEEANVVINPRHRDYHHVTLSVIRPFGVDPRLLK